MSLGDVVPLAAREFAYWLVALSVSSSLLTAAFLVVSSIIGFQGAALFALALIAVLVYLILLTVMPSHRSDE